ncbi:hypothetical protein BC830DRAFT_1155812, partial [Chytriomyces sp. MP71]
HINIKKFGHSFFTMNPLYGPNPRTTIAAQDSLNMIQNKRLATFAGAWTNYGFHKDGITSGLLSAVSLGAKCPFEISMNGGYPTRRKPPPPAKGIKQYVARNPVFTTDAARQEFVKNVNLNIEVVGQKRMVDGSENRLAVWLRFLSQLWLLPS